MLAKTIIGFGGALLALWGLAGCGGSGGGPMAGGAARPDVGRSVPAMAGLSNISVTVATDKATYKTGDPIQITVSATNTAGTPITLSYPTTYTYVKWGYVVTTPDGTIVTYEYWDGHNEVFPAVIGSDTYAAGETRQFAYVFPYPILAGDPDTIRTLPAGTYKIYAKMPELAYVAGVAYRYSTTTPASAPVTITVTN